MGQNNKKDLFFLIFIIIITLFNTFLWVFIINQNSKSHLYCYLDYKNELHFSNDCRYNKCLNTNDDTADLVKDFILLGGGNDDR